MVMHIRPDKGVEDMVLVPDTKHCSIACYDLTTRMHAQSIFTTEFRKSDSYRMLVSAPSSSNIAMSMPRKTSIIVMSSPVYPQVSTSSWVLPLALDFLSYHLPKTSHHFRRQSLGVSSYPPRSFLGRPIGGLTVSQVHTVT